MQPHATFLDRFTTIFNRGDEEAKVENRRKITGVNNLLYSAGDVDPHISFLQAEHVHIYSHKRGYYEPELHFLQYALDLLNIKYEFHDIDYPHIGYGDLPLFRVEYLLFTKDRFLEIILRLLFNGADIQEELSTNGIVLLCRELNRITNYFMWSTSAIHYRYRNRYWLLFQPIWRSQEIYKNYKKRVALSEEGVESDTYALEKAKELLTQLEKAHTTFGGFYPGNKGLNSLKAQIIDLLVYCYLEEIIRNTVKSELYDLLATQHPVLKKFAEDFQISLPQLIEARRATIPNRIRYKKPELQHTYKSRYRTAEEIKKEQTNSIFLTVSSVSLLLYVYFYYKG